MAWTYNLDLLEDKDQVRFLIGDTNESGALVQDEEIAFALRTEGSVYAAGALIAESLSAQYAQQTDRSIGDLKLRFSDRSGRYASLAAQLRKRLLLNVRFHTAGAESISSKDIDPADTDLVQPFFTRDMLQHEESNIRGDQ